MKAHRHVKCCCFLLATATTTTVATATAGTIGANAVAANTVAVGGGGGGKRSVAVDIISATSSTRGEVAADVDVAVDVPVDVVAADAGAEAADDDVGTATVASSFGGRTTATMTTATKMLKRARNRAFRKGGGKPNRKQYPDDAKKTGSAETIQSASTTKAAAVLREVAGDQTDPAVAMTRPEKGDRDVPRYGDGDRRLSDEQPYQQLCEFLVVDEECACDPVGGTVSCEYEPFCYVGGVGKCTTEIASSQYTPDFEEESETQCLSFSGGSPPSFRDVCVSYGLDALRRYTSCDISFDGTACQSCQICQVDDVSGGSSSNGDVLLEADCTNIEPDAPLLGCFTVPDDLYDTGFQALIGNDDPFLTLDEYCSAVEQEQAEHSGLVYQCTCTEGGSAASATASMECASTDQCSALQQGICGTYTWSVDLGPTDDLFTYDFLSYESCVEYSDVATGQNQNPLDGCIRYGFDVDPGTCQILFVTGVNDDGEGGATSSASTCNSCEFCPPEEIPFDEDYEADYHLTVDCSNVRLSTPETKVCVPVNDAEMIDDLQIFVNDGDGITDQPTPAPTSRPSTAEPTTSPTTPSPTPKLSDTVEALCAEYGGPDVCSCDRAAGEVDCSYPEVCADEQTDGDGGDAVTIVACAEITHHLGVDVANNDVLESSKTCLAATFSSSNSGGGAGPTEAPPSPLDACISFTHDPATGAHETCEVSYAVDPDADAYQNCASCVVCDAAATTSENVFVDANCGNVFPDAADASSSGCIELTGETFDYVDAFETFRGGDDGGGTTAPPTPTPTSSPTGIPTKTPATTTTTSPPSSSPTVHNDTSSNGGGDTSGCAPIKFAGMNRSAGRVVCAAVAAAALASLSVAPAFSPFF